MKNCDKCKIDCSKCVGSLEWIEKQIPEAREKLMSDHFDYLHKVNNDALFALREKGLEQLRKGFTWHDKELEDFKCAILKDLEKIISETLNNMKLGIIKL